MDSPAPSSATAASAAPATPGATLAAARVAQGYTIEDISQRLKLSPAQIRAIEADDHAKLPGPVFARGFIRSYARFLKLDGVQLLQPKPAPVPEAVAMPAPPVVEVRAPVVPTTGHSAQETLAREPVAELLCETVHLTPRETPREFPLEARHETARAAPSEIVRETIIEGRLRGSSRETLEPSPYRRVPALLGGVAVVVLGLAYYEFFYNVPVTPAVPAAPAVKADSMATPVTPVASSTIVASSTPAMPAASVTPAGQAESANALAPVPQATAAKPEAPLAPLALKKSGDPAGSATNGLHFVFNGESWVEVRDGGGNIVFSRINEAGSERHVQGTPPLSVVVGGSSRVQLSYNGKAIDLQAYTRENVARLRLE